MNRNLGASALAVLAAFLVVPASGQSSGAPPRRDGAAIAPAPPGQTAGRVLYHNGTTTAPPQGGGAIAPAPPGGGYFAGGVIYDNGTTDPNTDSANEMSSWVQADDFELSSAANVDGAQVDWVDVNFGNQWDGGIHWYIFADSGGMPGALIDSGSGIPLSTVLISTAGGFDWWTTEFDFDHAVSLSANTRYWLGLHWAGDFDWVRDDVYWAYSSSQNYSFSYESDDGLFNNWANVVSEDRGFRLLGGSGPGATIDFELGGPCNFSSQVALSNEYAGLGALFSGPAPGDGGCVLDQCSNFGVNALSGTNFLAFNDNSASMTGTPTGPETITFNNPASAVSIWVAGGGGSGALFQLDAYSGAVLVDSMVGGGQSWSQLSVSGSGITHVVLDEIGTDAAWVADDLTFDSPSSGPDVLYVAADYADCVPMVQAGLLATGQFGSVDTFDASVATPSLALLQSYDAVLTNNNFAYADPNAMGDVLADYVDAGGAVVVAMFGVGPPGQLGGRWQAQGYYIIPPNGFFGFDGPKFLGTVLDPTHPIMQGVNTFDGGAGSFRPSDPSVNNGTRIAEWDDGSTLVAVGGSGRVDLGMWPGGFNGCGSANGWNSATDGFILMANALSWSVGLPCPDLVYCDANPDNGADLTIDTCDTGAGSNSLLLSGAPANQFGYPIIGAGNGVSTDPPGAQGDLCLIGAAIGRYGKDAVFTDGAGAASVDIWNSTSGGGGGGIPNPPGGTLTAGATWNFQWWHRDGMNPSKFSKAIQVTFQ